MAVTLRDVAVHAGVSVRTVSNVVNDFPQVSPHTRATVQRSIDALGYRPNRVARRLRSGRTGVVGLLIPRLAEHYFAELADAVVTVARENELSIVVDQTDGRRDSETSPLRQALDDGLWDGAIVSPLSMTRSDLGRHANAPLVALGEHGATFDLAWVGTDNVAAARDATDHLISLGRSRIAVIGDQHGFGGETGALRTRGYRAAMRAAGFRVRRDWVVAPGGYERVDGAQAMRRLLALAHPPEAVFCFNDELAFGALHALHAAGVRVPDDIAVIGWDDLRDAQFCVPSLTSVSVDRFAVARAAIDRLVPQFAGLDTTHDHVVIPHRIAVRASTAGDDRTDHRLTDGGTR
ncbi:LacI family DNA-binding transcriptional regulator [Flexivirga caeni]|uniref:LacI family transcriptional regulator n=1 Tax=Flexivirga caeni TaxID=2294115 RepID=A0A3M9MB29_9MICO|nr:LacI family DNA-binding transcriptional regulator [Flexivirga caeni]RNI22780.1 LacI family transcriptional regulator [Flexivirga caeni]